MSNFTTKFVFPPKRHNGKELPHNSSIYCYFWMLFGNGFRWRFIWCEIERERQGKHTHLTTYYISTVWGIKCMKDFLHHFFFSVYHHYYLHITSNFFFLSLWNAFEKWRKNEEKKLYAHFFIKHITSYPIQNTTLEKCKRRRRNECFGAEILLYLPLLQHSTWVFL